jgi:hypothetical protein
MSFKNSIQPGSPMPQRPPVVAYGEPVRPMYPPTPIQPQTLRLRNTHGRFSKTVRTSRTSGKPRNRRGRFLKTPRNSISRPYGKRRTMRTLRNRRGRFLKTPKKPRNRYGRFSKTV